MNGSRLHSLSRALIFGAIALSNSAGGTTLFANLNVTAPTTADQLPVYPIDVKFFRDHSVLKTVSESEALKFGEVALCFKLSKSE